MIKKKQKEKKCAMFESMHGFSGILTRSPEDSLPTYILDHCATQPLNIVALNLLYLKRFSLP